MKWKTEGRKDEEEDEETQDAWRPQSKVARREGVFRKQRWNVNTEKIMRAYFKDQSARLTCINVHILNQ